MSNREKCLDLLNVVPDYKIGYVLAYLQGLTADEVDIPNDETAKAIEDARNGIGLSRPFHSIAELMEDLYADD